MTLITSYDGPMTPPIVTVIRTRGIGEPIPGPMLCAVTNDLPPQWHRVSNPWLAMYGSPMPFIDAVQYGAEELIRMTMNAPGPVVWLGYSGGCVVIHRAWEMMTRAERTRVVCIGMVSDPEQPRGVTGDPLRHGIRGGRELHGAVARWAADPKDGICLCPDPSPLRWLAQQSQDIGLGSRLAITANAKRSLDLRRIPAYTFNIWDLAGERRRFAEARDLIDGYLLRGDHTGYASRKEAATGRTYVQNMAAFILREVERVISQSG